MTTNSDRDTHGVALDRSPRGIVCVCGEICNAVEGRSPVSGEWYYATNAETTFAHHLQKVRKESLADRDTRIAKDAVTDLVEAAQHPHKGPHDTDASMLREAAKRAEGGYVVGGSNTQRTVAAVLRVVARLIEENVESGSWSDES